jgi:hypothetical protein
MTRAVDIRIHAVSPAFIISRNLFHKVGVTGYKEMIHSYCFGRITRMLRLCYGFGGILALTLTLSLRREREKIFKAISP